LAFMIFIPVANALYSDCYIFKYPVNYNGIAYLTIDTKTLIDTFKLKPDCSNLEVYKDDIKISRYVANCNSNSTYVFFRVNQSSLEEVKYCINYGLATVYEPNNITIFDFWDDFENTTRSSAIWSGTYSFASGYNSLYSLYLQQNREAYTSANFSLLFFNFMGTGSVTTTSTVSLSSTSWSFMSISANNYVRFSAGKNQNLYVDNVLGISNYVEPLIVYVGRFVSGFVKTEKIKYCEGDFVVSEEISCRNVNMTSICETNQTRTYCYYGCYEGECVAPYFQRSLVIIGSLIAIFLLLYLFWKLRGD
ncbi:MAG: hypothetical protein QXW34_05270, partial [Candidatus Methanomethyliaceae archaeon]